LPFFDGTVAGGLAQVLATNESLGPVRVEFEVVFQSTWNFQIRTRFVQPDTTER
jgi:hypothetical protein